MTKQKITFLVILLIGLVTCVLLTGATSKNKRWAKEFVAKIENFRRENKRLPVSIKELDIPEKWATAVFYRKDTDDKYIVWYGTGLGESVTYSSDTKEWR